MPVPGAVPAPLPRRLLALVIDVVAVVLLGGAFVLVGVRDVLASLSGDPAEVAQLPQPSMLPLVGAVLLVVLGLVQWRMLATQGRTLGRRFTGIRLVRTRDGRVPGAGRALVRLAVPVLAWLVPVLGPVLLHLSPLTDARRRGWHDKAAGLMAVDVVAGIDPTLATVATRRLDDVLRARARHVAGPVATAVPGTVPGADPVPRPEPAEEPVVTLPWQVRREADPVGTAPLVDVPSRLAVATEAALPERAVGRVPVVAGVPNGLRRASALLDLEDTADGESPVARHVAEPRRSDGQERAPASVSHAGAMPGDVTDTAGRPVTRIVPSAASPVHTSTPFTSTHEEEDVESTRLRPARGKVPELAGRSERHERHERHGHEVTVELTDGQRATVTGTALVGRDPAPRPGEESDLLIRVADPGRSVSKTHLRLGVDRGGLWVVDRDSTNGTVVTLVDGQQILCGAEQQVRLPTGATVAFGDYGLSVAPGDA